MPYPKHDSKKGGYAKPAGKSFGGPRKFGASAGYAPRKSFGDKPVEAHDAICDVCGKACRVPFRPNGSKPVLCTNCFKKDRGSESTYSGRRSAGSEERVPGAFGAPRKFAPAGYGAPSAARPMVTTASSTAKLEKRLDTIEAKLDMILKKLGASGAKAALGEDEFSL